MLAVAVAWTSFSVCLRLGPKTIGLPNSGQTYSKRCCRLLTNTCKGRTLLSCLIELYKFQEHKMLNTIDKASRNVLKHLDDNKQGLVF